MTMDCAGCPIAGHGCADCVVTVLFAAELGLPLDPQEGRAVATLREAGLISAAEASRARAVWVSEPRQAPVDLRGSATG
ncbi:MAG: hypothetical protein IPL94_07620 [Tetrasphaera sp.]|nr:hypothetical protein [Tetrasphaera sp.]